MNFDNLNDSWWRHQMETFSALLAVCARNSPVPGDFPIQRPLTRSFDVFIDLRLNKRLSKQSWSWWFETLSRPLWRHCNVLIYLLRLNHLSKVNVCNVNVNFIWIYGWGSMHFKNSTDYVKSFNTLDTAGADQIKHQSSASLAFVWTIHRWPVDSPHKRPITRKMLPFDDVIMCMINFREIW